MMDFHILSGSEARKKDIIICIYIYVRCEGLERELRESDIQCHDENWTSFSKWILASEGILGKGVVEGILFVWQKAASFYCQEGRKEGYHQGDVMSGPESGSTIQLQYKLRR